MKNVFKDNGKPTGGFTLIEVLVAIIIFSIGIMALSTLSIAVIQGNQTSRRFLEATTAAQSMLEGMRFYKFELGGDYCLGLPGTAAAADDNGGLDPNVAGGLPRLPIPAELTNTNTANDALTDPAAMFASPDHAYGGVEIVDAVSGRADFYEIGGGVPPLNNPVLVLSRAPRRAWVVRDSVPAVCGNPPAGQLGGMKTITVVVGWLEGPGAGTPHYVTASTVIQERRYP